MRRALIRILTALSILLVAGLGGYLFSTHVGRDLLRAEIEARLAEVMKGEVQVESLRFGLGLGLRVEGTNIEVYPSPRGAALSADRARAEIDLLSLLVGDFELRKLEVEGGHFRIERHADGEWFPYPVAAVFRDEKDEDPEPELAILRACEEVVRELLGDKLVASWLRVADGRVSLDDWLPGGADAAPLRVQLEALQGSLDHRWISGRPSLELSGDFVDSAARRAKLEARGEKRRDGTLALRLAVREIWLGELEPYARLLGPEAGLSGWLSGVVQYETPEKESGALEMDWLVREFQAALPRGDALVELETEGGAVESRIELHPGRVRLDHARLKGETLGFALEGVVERPLRESSSARAEIAIEGADLDVLQRFVGSLPQEDRETLVQIMERVESGEIERIGGSGTARVSVWRRLLAGELRVLPPGFAVEAAVRDVSVATGGEDRLTELEGSLRWSGDQIEFRDLKSHWNGAPLPQVEISMIGVSQLFASVPARRELRAEAGPLPGLTTLSEVVAELASSGEDAPEEPSEFPRLLLDLQALHHPALRFPLEDAQLTVMPTEGGVQVEIVEGRWAGAPIRGEMLWLETPEPRLNLRLVAAPPGPDFEAPALDGRWMFGSFAFDPLDRGALAFREFGGDFAVSGSTLYLSDVSALLAPQGSASGHGGFDLSRKGVVQVELGVELSDGEAGRLSPLVGLPTDFTTGRVRATGSLEGELRPGGSPLAGLDGFVSFKARDGEIRQELPLVVALARATEGFNPFASRQTVTYESIEALLEFDQGRISTENFQLEGPMRVFCSGHLDLAAEPTGIEAVVGVFLFRQADRMLGRVPLVKSLISDKGLVGAYFRVAGAAEAPAVKSLPVKSLAAGVPDLVKTPFKVLEALMPPANRAPDGSDGAATENGQGRRIRRAGRK